MSANDPSPMPGPRPAGEGAMAAGEAVVSRAASTSGSPPVAPRLASALTAALLAGLASWVVGEQSQGYFTPSHESAADPYSYTALRREKVAADSRNTAIAYGALGAFLGLGLGLAGGARRSIPAGLAAALVGGLLGGAAGVGLSFVVVPYYLRSVDPAQPSLILPLLAHGGIWTAIGAAGGLALGLGSCGWGRAARTAVGGALGALVGTVAFEILQAVAFPLLQSEELLGPTSALRLSAFLCVTAFAAGGALAQEMVSTRRAPSRATTV